MGNRFETATLGGGCFWCLEAAYEQLVGVESVVSGYAGGHVANPSYEAVCDGDTGHAEVVQVTFDPAIVSYREILEVFFSIHDPTTKDRQGNDVGPQYRSIILTHTEAQRQVAESVKKEIGSEGIWEKPIVTTIEPLDTFYAAEDYHQSYYRRNPLQPYCMGVVRPKLAKFRAKWAGKLKSR